MDNPTVEKQFEDYFDLFSRPGWALLMEDLENMTKSIDSIDYVSTIEDLHKYKGQLEILRRLTGFKNAMEAAYEDFQQNQLDAES